MVTENKLVSYEYFMYQMKEFEVEWLLDSADKSFKQDWEIARFQSYVNLQMNSKKKIKLSDIIKFRWDSEKQEEEHGISNEEIERLKIRAQAIEKHIKK